MKVQVRPADETDFDQVLEIFREVVSTGDTYPHTPEISRDEVHRLLMEAPTRCYVAVERDRVLGAYYLEPNQPGLGSHVGHAGYMVAAAARGRGIGRALGEHSLREARRRGFEAMQFNLVVASNRPSVALWRSLGFTVVGTLPKAFRHQELGPVDALVMYRFLDDQPTG